MHRSRSLVVCAASVGGALALAAAVAGAVSLRGQGTPIVGPAGLSLALVAGAGVTAILRPRHTELLTLATVLVGVALIAQLYGRLGLLYAPGLVLMAVGVARSEDAEARAHRAAILRRARLASEWRTERLREQERTILQPRLQRPARRVG